MIGMVLIFDVAAIKGDTFISKFSQSVLAIIQKGAYF